jgi:hypothetical protein
MIAAAGSGLSWKDYQGGGLRQCSVGPIRAASTGPPANDVAAESGWNASRRNALRWNASRWNASRWNASRRRARRVIHRLAAPRAGGPAHGVRRAGRHPTNRLVKRERTGVGCGQIRAANAGPPANDVAAESGWNALRWNASRGRAATSAGWLHRALVGLRTACAVLVATLRTTWSKRERTGVGRGQIRAANAGPLMHRATRALPRIKKPRWQSG